MKDNNGICTGILIIGIMIDYIEHRVTVSYGVLKCYFLCRSEPHAIKDKDGTLQLVVIWAPDKADYC